MSTRADLPRPIAFLLGLRAALRERRDPDSAFAIAALERHKREGMELAVRARWIAMAIIAVMAPVLNFAVESLWFAALALGFVLLGWAQLRVARVERSRAEMLLILCDLGLMAVALLLPNPLSDNDWPTAMQYREQGFKYFFVLLALATLAYSWRTVWAIGVLTTATWALAYLAVWAFGAEDPALSAAAAAAFAGEPTLAVLLDPNRLLGYIRIQDGVVMLIVAATLAVTVRRFSRLVLDHAGMERERANLARYFSPNVVDELSRNDEPLKRIRNQDVAVLFVDLVGFTRYAAERSPEEVIGTLRRFHQRMEREVFRHEGTLDKYMGDGLMATFGTPVVGEADALNALRCARAMMRSMAEWNAERKEAGEPPIRASFGLHYGPAVLGDIGANRLEFAVIGNTVNVASRVEALTRTLSVELAATDDLVRRAREEAAEDAAMSGFVRHDGQEIRGLDARMTVWALARAA